MHQRPMAILLFAWLATVMAFARPRNTRDAATTTDNERTVAALHAGAEEDDFKRACDTNRHLHFDATNRALFACETLSAEQIGPDTTPYTSTATYPLNQTFLLHSRPGANRVIYLDFKGHITSGTIWNEGVAGGGAFTSPPFDTDGNPASFSDAELAAVQDVWRRVAEDYAPWDVDVTTEDPGNEAIRRTGLEDVRWGVRCVIGGSSKQWLGGAAGGVAYVGTFGQEVAATEAPSDVPCFVFPVQLSNNPRYIGEAASHEIGHTLGLYHNGQTNGIEYYTGHANWAPIMGVGYYKPVTQWTKGDYPLSNSKQDQLAIIGSRIPSAGPPAGAGAPSVTPVEGNDLIAGGVIATTGQRNWFRITAGPGSVVVKGVTSSPSPNLKLGLSLVNSVGTVLAVGTPDGMNSNLTVPVSGGTYYLIAEGIGTGTATKGFTNYGSLGRYGLLGSWEASEDSPPPSGTNAAPTASATGSAPLSGGSPLTVQFVGVNSADPDGIIVGYQWDFGDDQTSTLANPVHVYTKPGSYIARLTVVDNSGSMASATLAITVGATAPGKTMRVGDLTAHLVIDKSGKGSAEFTVAVVDGNGLPLPKAKVSASVSGLVSGVGSAQTGKTGEITFYTSRIPAGTTGAMTFRVTNLVLSGYTYDFAKNTLTEKELTISIPDVPPKNKKNDPRKPER